MAFGKNKKIEASSDDETVADSTGWIIHNPIAHFVLLHAFEIKIMCMVVYCFVHGCKVWKTAPKDSSGAYKLVSLAFSSTGGGLLIPIFLNTVPVVLADAYPITLLAAFAMHMYAPILREVYSISSILQFIFIAMYETNRAYVVVLFTNLGAATIKSAMFTFPVFGPIICGGIAGCGGIFLPLSKGLDPILKGLADPMKTALIGATMYHFFMSTSLSEGVIDAGEKAHVAIALYFIIDHWMSNFGITIMPKFGGVKLSKSPSSSSKPTGSKKKD